MSAIYRVRQFVRAAGAWVQAGDTDTAAVHRYLPPGGVRLFQAMSSYDQQHGLNVMHTLAQRGYTDPDLLAAAVLHDVGKTARKAGSLHLWHRVTVVLMRTLMPGLVEQLGEDPGGGWRQAFFVHQHHAAIGAELAQQAGCSARTVELIRHHENAPDQTDDRLLAALQAADSSN